MLQEASQSAAGVDKSESREEVAIKSRCPAASRTHRPAFSSCADPQHYGTSCQRFTNSTSCNRLLL